jgi:Type II secretion system (T2SS), protein G
MTKPLGRIVVPLALLATVVGGVLLIRSWFDHPTNVHAARLKLSELERAVRLCKMSSGDYPPDLETLTRAQPGSRAPLEQEDLLDPWGRPYVYEPGNRHPTTGTPRIYSQGADPADPEGVIANW